MLTDIVGFTTLAEQSAPAAVTDFVNRHFTMLNACVEAEGGTVAQFIGDSVMSFWGAPDPQPDHAARACRAALAIGRGARGRERAPGPRGPGAGPHAHRHQYRHGHRRQCRRARPQQLRHRRRHGEHDPADRAAGQDPLPDQPTVAILVSARTRALAGAGFTFVEAGAHEVRGRREPVMIYRLAARLATSARGSAAAARPAAAIVADVASRRHA